jgi:hypothetical protein
MNKIQRKVGNKVRVRETDHVVIRLILFFLLLLSSSSSARVICSGNRGSSDSECFWIRQIFFDLEDDLGTLRRINVD